MENNINEYIKQQRSKNVLDDQIKADLRAAGWQDSSINEAFTIKTGLSLGIKLLIGFGVVSVAIVGAVFAFKKDSLPVTPSMTPTTQTNEPIAQGNSDEMYECTGDKSLIALLPGIDPQSKNVSALKVVIQGALAKPILEKYPMRQIWTESSDAPDVTIIFDGKNTAYTDMKNASYHAGFTIPCDWIYGPTTDDANTIAEASMLEFLQKHGAMCAQKDLGQDIFATPGKVCSYEDLAKLYESQ